MVKNFDHFTDVVDWDLPDDKITLDMSGGEKWRALRFFLNNNEIFCDPDFTLTLMGFQKGFKSDLHIWKVKGDD